MLLSCGLVREIEDVNRIFVLSTISALVLPPTLVGVPGWMHAILGIAMPIYGKRMNRRRQEVISAERGEPAR